MIIQKNSSRLFFLALCLIVVNGLIGMDQNTFAFKFKDNSEGYYSERILSYIDIISANNTNNEQQIQCTKQNFENYILTTITNINNDLNNLSDAAQDKKNLFAQEMAKTIVKKH